MKLNKRQHVSKLEKADLTQAKSNLAKQDKRLQPSSYLSDKGKRYFEILAKYLGSQTTTASIDSLQLNELSEELATYDIASGFIAKQGLIVDGKKNPLIAIRNNALKNILSLSSSLGLSIQSRIKANLMDVQNGAVDDPLEDLIS